LSTPAQVWSYRTLIVNLAQRELKSRYKRSLLGWMWSLINPAVTLGVYTVVFGVFFKAQAPVAGNGESTFYALWLFCGLVMWNLFSGVINTAISSFSGAGGLLTRTYFPPECPMIAGLITVIIQALLEGGILIFFMAVIGNLSFTMLIILPLFVLMSCFAFGIGLVLGLLNIRYRDVFYLTGIALQVLFYATPIVYQLSILPSTAQAILRFNPLTSFVGAIRQVAYFLDFPTPGSWMVMISSATVSVVGGWMIFSRWAPTVIEEL
jgi:ABC-type polysaccharide/polyol phosphate export permease